ncbi:MAG: YdbH domain-containing protein [Kiloniellales bacterium]
MRRLLLALLFLLALLAALIAGLVLVRHEAAEMAIRHGLASEGIRNATFVVTDISSDRARVENLVLGRYRNVQAKSVEVRFDGLAGWKPWEWNPSVAEVRVSGLDLRLNAQGDGGPLNDPDLDRLLSGPEEAEVGEASAIPPIVIEDARILATTADGEMEVLLNGSVVRPPDGALAGQFAYVLETPFGLSKGAIEIFQDPDQPLRVAATAEGATLDLPGAEIDSLQAAIELTLPEDALPQASGEVTIKGIGPLDGYVEEITLSLEADPSRIDLDVAALAVDGSTVGSGRIAIARLDSRPQVKADLTLNAIEASAQLGLLDPSGSLTVESRLTATLPPLVDLIHDRGGRLIQLLEDATLASKLTISADRLTVPGKVLGLSADLHLDVLLEDAKLRAWVSEEGRLAVSALDPEWSLLADLPEDTRRAVWRNLALTLPFEDGVGLQATAVRSEAGVDVSVSGPILLTSGQDTKVTVSGRVDGSLSPEMELHSWKLSALDLAAQSLPVLGNRISRLTLVGDAVADDKGFGAAGTLDAKLAEIRQGEVQLRDVSLRLPILLTSDGEQAQVALTDEGRVSLDQIYLDEVPFLLAPATLVVDRLALRRSRFGAWRPRLTLGSDTLSLTTAADGSRIDLSGLTADVTIGLDQEEIDGLAVVDIDAVTLPKEGLQLSKVSVRAPLPPDRLEQEAMAIEVGSAALSADGQSFAGMSLSARLTKSGEIYRLKGRGRGPNGQGSIAVSLEQNLASERGKLDASWGPITFAPDGLQPGQISAELEDLADVSGKVAIKARAEWSPVSDNVAAEVSLQSLSATLLPVEIEGLNGELSFLSLTPPVSDKAQEITIDKLDVGVPLSNLLLGFVILDSQGGPALDAKTLQTDFAGGRLIASPFRISGPEDAFATTVEVTHVKLDQLTDILDLGDIQLEGRVIGQIPVTLDLASESIAIENGWLQAVDEGVIRIPNAAERLGLGEVSKEQKDLLFALEALSDFHYSYLYATVSFGADGDLDLALTLEGNNPQVLDGYPFKFNITFGVDLADLLIAFRRGREITPELFDGAWSIK